MARCRLAILPTPVSAHSQEVTPANVGVAEIQFLFLNGPAARARSRPHRDHATRCTSSRRTRTCSSRSALDKPGAPLKWKYEPKPRASSQGVACCDSVNRGAAYAAGRVFFNTLDGQTVAVDANDGHELWRAQLGDISRGESITMAPLVVKDKVLVGNSGGEFGVRGWLTALDARTGHQAWRAYSTGPDSEVLIGNGLQTLLCAGAGYRPRGEELAGRCLEARRRHRCGGLDFLRPRAPTSIFYGTANPGRGDPEQRPGDNKWTAGVFARDPDAGAAKWFYQYNPHDLNDYDGVNENVLIDLEIGGRMLQSVRAPRSQRLSLRHRSRDSRSAVGHAVRERGRRSAISIFKSGWRKQATGQRARRRQGDPEHVPCRGRQQGLAAFGVVAGHAIPLHPTHQNQCRDEEGRAGELYRWHAVRRRKREDARGRGIGHRGVFTAWDVAAGRPVWETRRTSSNT